MIMEEAVAAHPKQYHDVRVGCVPVPSAARVACWGENWPACKMVITALLTGG